MADDTKCTTLYLATTQLAYAINRQARTPSPPFTVDDQDALYGRSTDVADAARDFRNCDPAEVADDAVDRAAVSVKKAQVMIDTINLELNNGYSAGDIYAAIDTAAQDVSAIRDSGTQPS